MPLKIGACVLLLLLSSAASVGAEEEDTPASQAMKRSWAYLDDAATPAVSHTIALSRITFAAAGESASRPFASDLARPGALLEAGAEVGVTRFLSFEAQGASDALGLTARPASGVSAGLRFAPFAATWTSTRLVLGAGYLSDLAGNHGAWGKVALVRDIGLARVAASAYGEHVFSPQRDALDVMVMAGASYAIAGPLRAGVEYVAQDLEGAIDPAESEGMRHFVGPTLGLELAQKRLSVAAGPAVGLSSRSPSAVGRASIAYSF